MTEFIGRTNQTICEVRLCLVQLCDLVTKHGQDGSDTAYKTEPGGKLLFFKLACI